MKFLIVTHTPHIISEGKVYAYGPYVREMNLWGNHVDRFIIVAPVIKTNPTKIHLPYDKSNIKLLPIPSFSLTSVGAAIKAVFVLPVVKLQVWWGMIQADHIHLRCPGNVGLVGAFIQVLFPKKKKTAKYAGNWDPSSKQPLSYRIQKKILSNTFWTRNMNVLVYGSWPDQSSNIVSFFTATYQKDDRTEKGNRSFNEPYSFIFVGGLTPGKRPMYAIQLVERLILNGWNCELKFYGDGSMREELVAYIESHDLECEVSLHGNQTAAVVKQAYQGCHFLILPSKSEGWPKVVAEAMFWGCIPLVSRVSCVPWMLDEGNRGVLLSMDLDADVISIQHILSDVAERDSLSEAARKWSRNYTLDRFENEIKQFL